MEQREFTRVVFEAKAAVASSTASLEGSVLNLGLGVCSSRCRILLESVWGRKWWCR